jgi:hypothetical protein
MTAYMGHTEQERQPRSTQAEMEFRRQHVMERLQDGPKSLQDLFGDTEWTYAQAVITLRKMKDDREICVIRKDGREVIYDLYENANVPPMEVSRIIETIATGDTCVHVVGVNFEDGLSLDLKLSTGEIFEARLVA